MRILMASHGYPPVISGVTLVVRKIARAMARRGHDVTVVTASETGRRYEDEDEGVRLIRLGGFRNPFWREAPIPFIGGQDLAEVLDDVRPDLLHAHDAGFIGVQLLGAARRRHIFCMATCYYVPRFVARYLSLNGDSPPLVERLVWAYSIWLFNRFDHVVFATATHERRFRAQGLTSRSSLISNGIDLTRYHPMSERPDEARVIARRYGLPAGPRILCVGRLARDKEIDVLIRAMPAVRAERNAHLLLVGRGDDRARLASLVERLGLQSCVHFLGFVPEEDLPALYRASDLFAIASTYEVQSLPTLQALATAKPVVAADAVALPELVHDGSNGYLVPPKMSPAFASAILNVLRRPGVAERMGQAGLEIVRRHGDPSTFDGYEALYWSAVGERSAARAYVTSGTSSPYGEEWGG